MILFHSHFIVVIILELDTTNWHQLEQINLVCLFNLYQVLTSSYAQPSYLLAHVIYRVLTTNRISNHIPFQILTESYLLNQKSAVYNNQNNENLQSAHSNESVSDTTIKSSESEKTEETDVSSDLSINSSAASSQTPTPPPPASSTQPPIESKPKKESGFLNKCEFFSKCFQFDSIH